MKFKIALAGLLCAIAVMSLPEGRGNPAPDAHQLQKKKTYEVASFANSEEIKIQSRIDALKEEFITFEKPWTYCEAKVLQPVNDFKSSDVKIKLNKGPPVIRI